MPVLPPGLEHYGKFLAQAELPQYAQDVMADGHGARQRIRLLPPFHHAHAQPVLCEQQCQYLPDRPGSCDQYVAVVLFEDGGETAF